MATITHIEPKRSRKAGPAPVPIVGPLLRRYRERLGYSQQEAGRILGYRYGNFIGMIETGSSRFPTERWEEYANAFEIPKTKMLKALIKEQFPNMLPFLEFKEPKKDTDEKQEDVTEEDDESLSVSTT